MDYEYRVIPAPKRLKKVKGVASPAERFAATLTDHINAEAREGWEYVRSESLAAEEPGGLFRRGSIVEETMMIFRRPRRSASADEAVTGEAPSREPSLGAPQRVGEPRGAGAFPPAAAEAGRGRPMAGLFGRGPLPRTESLDPAARPKAGPGAPPLLRPVPRHDSDEKS